MKKNLTTSDTQRKQPIMPADMLHIATLAEQDDRELLPLCARYRRRNRVHRVAIAACLVGIIAFEADSVYARAPQYTETAISGNFDVEQASNTIHNILIEL